MKLSDKIVAANSFLSNDVKFLLRGALRSETSKRGRKFLEFMQENIKIAEQKRIPLCQDTGTVSFYSPLKYKKTFLEKQTSLAYKKLRQSHILSPFKKVVDDRNLPAIHYRASGPLKFIIRGGGSQNCSALKMLNPSFSGKQVLKIVSDFVIEKAPYCCPPVFVAVSLGGTPSTAMETAEEVLLQNLTKKSSHLEREILNRINKSGIGPGGWGGKNTALCVRIKETPCHIATFPVGIVISCWCLRKGIYNG